MTKLKGTLLWLLAVAAAMFPVIAEASIPTNHNETLVRDRR